MSKAIDQAAAARKKMRLGTEKVAGAINSVDDDTDDNKRESVKSIIDDIPGAIKLENTVMMHQADYDLLSEDPAGTVVMIFED